MSRRGRRGSQPPPSGGARWRPLPGGESPDVAAGVRVEAGGGLVEDEEGGPGQGGDADEGAAAEAAGEELDPDVAVLLQVQLGYELVGADAGAGRGEAAELAEEPQQVVEAVEEVGRLLLGHYPHDGLDAGGLADDVHAEDADAAGGGHELGGDLPDEGCLAGAVGPQVPGSHRAARPGRCPVGPQATLVPLANPLHHQGFFWSYGPRGGSLAGLSGKETTIFCFCIVASKGRC